MVQFGDMKNAKYRTTYVRKEFNPVWNAQFSEEGPKLFERVKQIKFKVYDRDKMSKDDLMGVCTVQTVGSPKTFYASPMQWVTLQDEEGNTVLDENGNEGRIQISVRYAPKIVHLSVRNWTHVME